MFNTFKCYQGILYEKQRLGFNLFLQKCKHDFQFSFSSLAIRLPQSCDLVVVMRSGSLLLCRASCRASLRQNATDAVVHPSVRTFLLYTTVTKNIITVYVCVCVCGWGVCVSVWL